MMDSAQFIAHVVGLTSINIALLITFFPQGVTYWGYSWTQRIVAYSVIAYTDWFLYSWISNFPQGAAS